MKQKVQIDRKAFYVTLVYILSVKMDLMFIFKGPFNVLKPP